MIYCCSVCCSWFEWGWCWWFKKEASSAKRAFRRNQSLQEHDTLRMISKCSCLSTGVQEREIRVSPRAGNNRKWAGSVEGSLGTTLVFQLKWSPVLRVQQQLQHWEQSSRAASGRRKPSSAACQLLNTALYHKGMIFSINGLLYLRQSKAFAREIPRVCERNVTGCEPKGVRPEIYSMQVQKRDIWHPLLGWQQTSIGQLSNVPLHRMLFK